MRPTARADVERRFEIFFPDDLPASFALSPEAFGAHGALYVFRAGLLFELVFSFKPGHSYLRLTLSRVRMAPQGRKCAINLLCEHSAGKLVRKGHGRKGQQQVGTLAPGLRQPFGAADEKQQVT